MGSELQRGRIVLEGMGGYLNPPGHPEYHQSVETDLRRNKENRGGMSLSAAADCDYLHRITRQEARSILNAYRAPTIESREAQLWARQVLAHFRNCYRARGDDVNIWNADRMHICKPTCDAYHHPEDHAGVRWIRQWYPDWSLTELSADCGGCSHHVNAHANGEGGTCTVIMDMDGYKAASVGIPPSAPTAEKARTLCNCPEFTLDTVAIA